MSRQTLKLNKVADPDDVEMTLEGEKPEVDPTVDIEVKGFSQVEEDRDGKYIPEDFKIKLNDFGMWNLVRSAGGNMPKELKGSYTSETTAAAGLALFLQRQK